MKSAFPPSVRRVSLVVALVGIFALVATVVAGANVLLTKISDDLTTAPIAQHKTIVEPDTFSYGSTIVTAAQSGRVFDGGSAGIVFGRGISGSWTSGLLPGLTTYQNPPGPYARISDAAVAFDAKHNVWMVATLALNANTTGVAVALSRSTNGGSAWNNPVTIAAAGSGENLDKPWIVCDNTPASTWYGSCYAQWDDNGHNDLLKMAYSRNGGLNWTLSSTPTAYVIGGQPVVRGNGVIVVPLDDSIESELDFTRSTDGGVTYGPVTLLATITRQGDPGSIRTDALPSAETDGGGKIFVVWSDCRFRVNCAANDLVYMTSSDGFSWTNVQKIPMGNARGTPDYFIPGIGIDKSTLGANAHLGVAYYFYPSTSCTEATCQLYVGYVSSTNGGASWSLPTQLAGPMTTTWLPSTNQGRMVGDYISTSFAGGTAYPVFAVANAPTAGGSDCATATPNCDQALYTPASGLAAKAGSEVATGGALAPARPPAGTSSPKLSR